MIHSLRRWLFTYAGLLVCTTLFGQRDFRPGFIVTTASDTLYGEIDYRGDVAMGKACAFRQIGEGVTEYAPGEIAAYRFADGRLFLSEVIDEKPLFLECLATGIISLYYYRDETGNNYLVDKEGLKLTSLLYRESITNVDGRETYNRSRSHILTLNYFMSDVRDPASITRNLGEPKHHDLLRVLRAYHKALGAEEKLTIYQERAPFVVLLPELTGGFTQYYDVAELADQGYPEIGLIGHFWLPRINEKLYFRTGFSYSRLLVFEEKRGFVKVPLQLEYIAPSGVFRPRIAYGVVFNNLTAHTVSVNLGGNLKLAERLFLTASYDAELEQEFLLVPGRFVAGSIRLGCMVKLRNL